MTCFKIRGCKVLGQYLGSKRCFMCLGEILNPFMIDYRLNSYLKVSLKFTDKYSFSPNLA